GPSPQETGRPKKGAGKVWIRAADVAEFRKPPPPQDLLQTDHIERRAVKDFSERAPAQPDLTKEKRVEGEYPELGSHQVGVDLLLAAATDRFALRGRWSPSRLSRRRGLSSRLPERPADQVDHPTKQQPGHGGCHRSDRHAKRLLRDHGTGADESDDVNA